MKNYILIHGAWHGNWCWRKITPLLESQGHRVLAPNLPGHYGIWNDFKNINLSTYVESIEKLVRKFEKPVVLVGHSMAGVIISQVAENMPDKIERLIYISGFIPKNGKALIDEEKQAIFPGVGLEVITDLDKKMISLPVQNPEKIQGLLYGNCAEEDINFALKHLRQQPLRPFIEPISISASAFGTVPKLYIECLKDKAVSIDDQRRMHQRIQCLVATLDTDHSPFFSAPGSLEKLLIER